MFRLFCRRASAKTSGPGRDGVRTLAGLAVLGGSEAHLTLAAVAARRVQTLAVLTQVHVVRAFVHVWVGGSTRWAEHFKTQSATFSE